MTSEEKRELKQALIKNNKELFYTAKETCRVLRISRATLSRLQSSASIEFCKSKGTNGSVKFTVGSIIRYLEAHTVISNGEVV